MENKVRIFSSPFVLRSLKEDAENHLHQAYKAAMNEARWLSEQENIEAEEQKPESECILLQVFADELGLSMIESQSYVIDLNLTRKELN